MACPFHRIPCGATRIPSSSPSSCGGIIYGYEINKTIQQRTGGQYGFKEATLYTAFKRLEQSGLISSYWGEDGPGARRRYYAITEAGRQRWEENRREWHNTRALLDALIDIEEE